ncbi:hypothetical protein LUZ60_015512 [Juncus effusus]|nr:hypothetical protein LUZ60_015512 [Juncus effusus]
MASILCKLPLAAMQSVHLPPKPTQFRSISRKVKSHHFPAQQCFSGGVHTNPTFSNSLQTFGFGLKGLKSLGFLRNQMISNGSGGAGSGGGAGGGGGGGGGGGDDEDGSDDQSFFSWYLMALDKFPIITKAITSALLTLIGDLICQFVIDKVSKLDIKRTFVFTFLGLALVGPTLHVWYLYLSKLVKVQGATGAILRLSLDQFIFSPIFIGVFMSLLVSLEGKPSLVMPKLKQEWFPSVIANWQLWVPFQFLNFYFVPQKFQVLAANFVALAWNVILSFKAHKEVIIK